MTNPDFELEAEWLEVERIVNDAWSRGLRPPPDLTVWEWMDENMMLAGDSSEPGLYRSSRTPYVRGIAECLSASHPARDISIGKGSQLGLTTLGKGWVGYIVDCVPMSMLITLPKEGVAKEWSNQRLGELVETTPCLRGKILDSSKKNSGNTTFWKRIQGTGAFIKIAWSSSAVKLRSTPACFLLSDEVDGFEQDADGEGDPLALLGRRMTNFPRGKHFKISTPAEAPSRICAEFITGDQRYYFLPCPHCGHYQRLVFARLKWEKGRPETASYECVGCASRIEERYKTQMLAAGHWVATKHAPELANVGFAASELDSLSWIFERMATEKTVSFHLWTGYSPIGWESWESIARQWEAAQKDTKKLKVFVNTILGEAWEERGEVADWVQLYERRRKDREPGVVPAGPEVLFLDAAVDVQKDRLEIEVIGWGRNYRTYSIEYEVLRGDTSSDAVWRELEQYLFRDFPCEDGGSMPITLMGVDTGHLAPMVYRFARRQPQPAYTPAGSRILRPRTVVCTKGGYSNSQIIERVTSEDAAQKRAGVHIYWIGTHCAKEEFVLRWLPAKPYEAEGQMIYPNGYCEFPNYDQAYFQGLCSESRIITQGGKINWVRNEFRNEPLDLRVIHRAMYELYAGHFTEAHWKQLEAARLALSGERARRERTEPDRPAPGGNTKNYRGGYRVSSPNF